MPYYDHSCKSCGDEFAEFRRMDDPAPTECIKCGGELRRIYRLQRPIVDNTRYTCPITGVPITSKKAHRDNLKRHDCVEANEVYGSDGSGWKRPEPPDFKITKEDLQRAEADLKYGRAPRVEHRPELDN